MNYCPDRGWLIADEGRAWNDPIDYDVPGLPIFGCHRLRCTKCDAMVRSARALDFRSSEPDVDLVPIYQLPDLRQSPLLYEKPGVRLYLCRCDRWREGIGRPIEGESNDPFAPQFTWVCDGHPLADLPHVFDGVELTPENLADVAAKSLRVPPEGAAPEDKRGGFWPARLYTRLAGTRWQDLVSAAVSPLLRDPDRDVRSRAIQFFFLVRPPNAAEEAVALLAGDRSLYTDVPHDPTPMPFGMFEYETQEDTLWTIASPLVAKHGLARMLEKAPARPKIKRAWAFESPLSLDNMKQVLDEWSSSPWKTGDSPHGRYIGHFVAPDSAARIYSAEKGYVVQLESHRVDYPGVFESAQMWLLGQILPWAQAENVRECDHRDIEVDDKILP